jgi:hypothetical protein
MAGLTAAVEQDDRFAARIAADVTNKMDTAEGREFSGGQRTRRMFSAGHMHDLQAPGNCMIQA